VEIPVRCYRTVVCVLFICSVANLPAIPDTPLPEPAVTEVQPADAASIPQKRPSQASRWPVCTARDTRACVGQCETICRDHLSLRPFAVDSGKLRSSQHACEQDCRELCRKDRNHLTQERHGRRNPLAYVVQRFYQEEARCFPAEPSFLEGIIQFFEAWGKEIRQMYASRAAEEF